MDITKIQEQLTAHCPYLREPAFDMATIYKLEHAELNLSLGNHIRVKHIHDGGSSESNAICNYLTTHIGEGPLINCPRYLEHVSTCPLRELR